MSRPGVGAVFPPGTAEFVKHRLSEIAGVVLFLSGALLAVSFAGYTPADASLNSAADGPVQNLLGSAGAIVADIMIQSVGLASILPVLVLCVWGLWLVKKRTSVAGWLRVALTLVAMPLIAAALAVVPAPDGWPLASGLGGLLGDTINQKTALFFLALTNGTLGPLFVALMAGAFGLVSFIVALGLNRAEWFNAGVVVWDSAHRVRTGVKRGQARLGELAARHIRLEPTLDKAAPKTRKARLRKEKAETRRSKLRAVVEPTAAKTRAGRRARAGRQKSLDLGDTFQCPPLDLLDQADSNGSGSAISKDALEQNALLLAGVLEDFGVRGEIVKVRPGPVVTLYELEPAPGTKTSRVIGLSDDIARSMSAVSVRVAVVPGRNVIGIELPNARREMVHLRELLASDTFERSSGKLALALGKDIGGLPAIVDLASMPHLLIAGTTGSGKSVGINTMILSLLYRMTPEQLRFIMIDPKMLELSVYEGIPHLMAPVVTEPSKAITALRWAVREMEDRYRLMSHMGVRNISGYNARLAVARKNNETLTRNVQTGFDVDGKPVFEDQPLSMDALPHIVVVVDEMADLMLVAGRDVEAAIQRLAQMARAAGIHLIMATQRPSVDVITGTIKANFPTRVSFQVTSKIDSRTILGEQGAEQLLGQGDMLYMAGGGRIMRVHGPFVSDEEVEAVARYLKTQGRPSYVEAVTVDVEPDGGAAYGNAASKADVLYDQAVALVAREGKASTSFIQRHLQIGYNRAARIIEQMEKEGVVSKANRVGRREVLIGEV